MHSLPAPFLSVKDNFCYGLLSYLLYVYDKNPIPRSATTNQERQPRERYIYKQYLYGAIKTNEIFQQYCMCNQQRLRPAWAYPQTDQSLC